MPIAFILLTAKRPDNRYAVRFLGILILILGLNRVAISLVSSDSIKIVLTSLHLGINLAGLATVLFIIMRRREGEAVRIGDLLRHEKTLSRAMLDNMPVGIILKDLDGRYIAVNKHISDRYGLSPDELTRSSLGEHGPRAGFSPEQLEQARRDEEVVRSEHKVVSQEMVVFPKGGPRRDIILSRFPVVDPNDNVTMTGLTVIDITDLKKLERSLEQSQKMELVGKLAGGIAHDFNNVIGAISGYAQFIVEDAPKRSQIESFGQRILAASSRARQLIEQLLTYSRRENVQREPVLLADVVGETATLLQAILPATTKLTLSNRAKDSVVLANWTQLAQIVVNLCVNGSDALLGRPGELRIEIEKRNASNVPPAAELGQILDQPDGSIKYIVGHWRDGVEAAVIRVSDTGSGMTRDIVEKCFEPFFTTKPEGIGNGLGLFIIQSATLSLDGVLAMTTRPGQGTTFEIYIPMSSAGEKPGVVSLDAVSELVAWRGRILVVDDDIDFGDMVQIALERLGYETAICHDPNEAIRIFNEDPSLWDAVVTDQTMPGMTGSELIAQVKTLRPETVCILCSGYCSPSAAHKGAANGADAFLAKPLQPMDLAKSLQALMRTRNIASADSTREARQRSTTK